MALLAGELLRDIFQVAKEIDEHLFPLGFMDRNPNPGLTEEERYGSRIPLALLARLHGNVSSMKSMMQSYLAGPDGKRIFYGYDSLSEDVTAHSFCDCEEVEEEKKVPCGCGLHDIDLRGNKTGAVHWLGDHWSYDCAYERSLQLLAKAVEMGKIEDR